MTIVDDFPRRLHESSGFELARATWSPPSFQQLKIVLAPSPDAPAVARTCAREFLVDELPAAWLADVLLLISELVTNAVRHPVAREDEEIRLHLGVATDCVRVEVCDSGGGMDIDELSPPRADAAGGRGLRIVDAIATRWGRSVEDRHCVWFEMDRSA